MNAIQDEPHYTKVPVLRQPSLILDRAEIEALREKRKDPTAEELFQVALAAVEGRMDPASESYVDWQTLADPVWRTRGGLANLTLVESLAFFHAVTGDRKYADFARGIVFAVIRHKLADVESDHTFEKMKETVKYKGWRHNAGHDFGALMFALGVFYDLCCDGLTEEEKREFVAYAEECLALKHEMRAEVGRMSMNNRGARCSIGAGVLAMAISGDHTDQRLIDDAFGHALYDAEAFAHFAFGLDGAPYEGASYAANSSSWLVLFGRILARRGCRDFGRHWNVVRYPDYVLYTLAPGNRELILLNDCASDLPIHPLLAVSAHTKDPVARRLWDELRENLRDAGYGHRLTPYQNFLFYDPEVKGVGPAEAGYPLGKHFRERGIVVALTGWGEEDARATFFCGPQQFVCHRQEDQNSFTLCALGEKFAWDAGYGHYGLGVKRAYRRTDVHNAILIDGRGQNSYEEFRWSRGVMTAFRHADDRTWALGDARRCYGLNGSIERAERHFFFRRAPVQYLLIVDDVIADGDEHDVTWNFVTHPDNGIEISRDGDFLVRGRNADMRMLLRSPAALTARQNAAGEMPRLQVTQRARRARFAALLLPLADGVEEADLAAEFGEEEARVSVTINGETDAMTLGGADQPPTGA